MAFLMLVASTAHAQGIALTTLAVSHQDHQDLSLDFEVDLNLSRAVDDAMQRGVPLYFVAEATVYRDRWYWRDERVARVTRSWRIAYQPLTSTWRVSLGALSQSFPTQQAALSTMLRASHWKIADADLIDPREHYYVEFSYRLDNAQLPRPMQLDLAAQSDWRLAVYRTLKLD